MAHPRGCRPGEAARWRQILGEQAPEERILRCDERVMAQEQQQRQLATRQWKRGRQLLRAAAPPIRQTIIDAWNRSSIPAEAAYFADFVWRGLRDRGLQIASHNDDA